MAAPGNISEAGVRVVAAQTLRVLARALYVYAACKFVFAAAAVTQIGALTGGTPWSGRYWFVILPQWVELLAPLAAAITLSLSARGVESTPASRLGWTREGAGPSS